MVKLYLGVVIIYKNEPAKVMWSIGQWTYLDRRLLNCNKFNLGPSCMFVCILIFEKWTLHSQWSMRWDFIIKVYWNIPNPLWYTTINWLVWAARHTTGPGILNISFWTPAIVNSRTFLEYVATAIQSSPIVTACI